MLTKKEKPGVYRFFQCAANVQDPRELRQRMQGQREVVRWAEGLEIEARVLKMKDADTLRVAMDTFPE